MEAILNFDWKVFEWVENCLWNPVLDVVMTIITYLGEGGAVWIAVGVILLLTKKYRTVGVAVIAALFVHLLVNDFLLKNIIERPRPFDLEAWEGVFKYPELVSKPSSYSFPSGHSSSAFASATALIMSKKKGIYIPALAFAAVMAFSRVYIHVHYFSDIVAGATAGILYGIIAIFIVNLFKPVVLKAYDKIKLKRSKKDA